MAQFGPESATVLQFLGTFLLFAVGYGITAHIAARYVLGSVPFRKGLLVGVAPAAISITAAWLSPAATIAATLLADYVAIKLVYAVRYRIAALVAIVHYTVTVIVAITLFNLVRLLSTAPT